MTPQITVAWFSAGASSAVATKLMIKQVDKIIYQHVEDQHEDTMRFVRDCETWFGKPIEIQQSPYKCVENAIYGWGGANSNGYIRSVRGFSPCTELLKRRERKLWESENRFFNRLRYVWGMDSTEHQRAERLAESMSEDEHVFPLVEQGITKADAHGILREAGIARPAMYDLGFPNNNCVGCVKGGKGYWNKIRVDFPKVFSSRAVMERKVGASCINGVYLDELDPEAGRDCKIIVPECGAMCEAMTTTNSELM